MAIRRLLHSMGLRYRLEVSVPGTRRTVDIGFPKARVAVDVRGCYWHGCDQHGTVPQQNREWWISKLAANKARDLDTVSRMASAGWAVMVVWEHEDAGMASAAVAVEVRARQPIGGTATP